MGLGDVIEAYQRRLSENQRLYAHDAYEDEIAQLRHEIRLLNEANAGNFWRWQGDGYDFPESLTCPILISPDQLRDLLNRATPKEG